MEREIKFRALYDHMGGGWKYGMLIYEGGVPRIQVDGTMTFATCLKGTEGQFTGLPDKNGNDIYEGDIMQSAGGRESYIVFWQMSGWKLKSVNNPDRIISFYPHNSKQIVIGNIHDNPTLLK